MSQVQTIQMLTVEYGNPVHLINPIAHKNVVNTT